MVFLHVNANLCNVQGVSNTKLLDQRLYLRNNAFLMEPKCVLLGLCYIGIFLNFKLVWGLPPLSIVRVFIWAAIGNFESNIFSQFLILLITYVVLDFLTLMIYGLAAEKISVWLKDKPNTLVGTSGD